MNTPVQNKPEDVNFTLWHETRKDAIHKADSLNLAMQKTNLASKIIDTTVKNYHGYNLGDLKDLVIDPESGLVVYAVVSFGGIFGLGGKLFAIPWSELSWDEEKQYYAMDVDISTLKQNPGFDEFYWPDSSIGWG